MGEEDGEDREGDMRGTTSLRGLVSPEMQILDTGIEEEEHEGGVEEGVEKPGTDAIATASGEVEEEDAKVAEEIGGEEEELAVEDDGEAGGGEAEGHPESVGVDD